MVEALAALDRITARRKALAARGVRITAGRNTGNARGGAPVAGAGTPDARLCTGRISDDFCSDRRGSIGRSAPHPPRHRQRRRHQCRASGFWRSATSCCLRSAESRLALRRDAIISRTCPACRSSSITRRQATPGTIRWRWRSGIGLTLYDAAYLELSLRRSCRWQHSMRLCDGRQQRRTCRCCDRGRRGQALSRSSSRVASGCSTASSAARAATARSCAGPRAIRPSSTTHSSSAIGRTASITSCDGA